MRHQFPFTAKRPSQSLPNAIIDEHMRFPRCLSHLLVCRLKRYGKLRLGDATSQLRVRFRIDLWILFVVQFFVKPLDRLFNRKCSLISGLIGARSTTN